MADYIACSRTNYFRVTDEDRYQELFSKLTSGGEIYDFSKEENGVVYHGFGSYDAIDYINSESGDEEYDMEKFINELQKILNEDDAFVYFESGHEKLRYVVGGAIVCTKDEIRRLSLYKWADAQARELLGEAYDLGID